MRSLLDVNVLIALLDQEHIFYERAWDWFSDVIEDGWASCPITQAGFVRIVSHPRYPAPISTTQAIRMLAEAMADAHHCFWPADVWLTDSTAIDRAHVLGPQQVTDTYLLALAVAHQGRFVTFDHRIALTAVPGATSHHLLRL